MHSFFVYKIDIYRVYTKNPGTCEDVHAFYFLSIMFTPMFQKDTGTKRYYV